MQHIEKKKDKTDSDLQEAVIVRTKRNLLDDVKKTPQTVLHFSLTFSSALEKKSHIFRKANCISKSLSSRKIFWFFCFIIISKFSVYWAYSSNC